MRFELRVTADGSLTVFDHDAGECYKSRHAAKSEAEHVFFQPAYLEHPSRTLSQPFRVLELGLGLGTNAQHFFERGFQGEFYSIERDLSGAEFLLSQEDNAFLQELVAKGEISQNGFFARILKNDFATALAELKERGFSADAILFDPFSPKANPEAWHASLFAAAAALLAAGGRLVTYSVSRVAKDGAALAGLIVTKRDLPADLQKRSALLATKPIHP